MTRTGTLVSWREEKKAQTEYAQTRTELLEAITTIVDAGRATGDLRADVTAEDIAAGLVGIFAVVGKPGQHAQASRLLNLLMDGLRPAAT